MVVHAAPPQSQSGGPQVSYVSYSQLETLLSCGEKYRLTKIVQVPEQPAWYLIGGSAVHAATEAYDLAKHREAHGE